MANQPNHGRDIETDILRVLAEADEGMAARDIWLRLRAEDRSVTTADIYRSMRGMPDGLIEGAHPRVPGGHRLTAEGRRMAEARGLTRRAEG